MTDDKKITKVTVHFDVPPGQSWYCNGVTIKAGEKMEFTEKTLPDGFALSLSEFASRLRKRPGMKVEVT